LHRFIGVKIYGSFFSIKRIKAERERERERRERVDHADRLSLSLLWRLNATRRVYYYNKCLEAHASVAPEEVSQTRSCLEKVKDDIYSGYAVGIERASTRHLSRMRTHACGLIRAAALRKIDSKRLCTWFQSIGRAVICYRSVPAPSFQHGFPSKSLSTSMIYQIGTVLGDLHKRYARAMRIGRDRCV